MTIFFFRSFAIVTHFSLSSGKNREKNIVSHANEDVMQRTRRIL